MTVAELIVQLRMCAPDTQVGYSNRCADDGWQFVAVDFAEVKERANYHLGQHPGLPESGAVVLS